MSRPDRADPSRPIARLRRVAAAAAGAPLEPDDAAWLAAAIAHYLDQAPFGASLDSALGLKPPAGRDPWWREEARARRNAAIAALYRQHFAKMRIPEAAVEIAKLARRASVRSSHPAPTAAADPDTVALLSEALSSGLAFPGPKQLQTILEINPQV